MYRDKKRERLEKITGRSGVTGIFESDLTHKNTHAQLVHVAN